MRKRAPLLREGGSFFFRRAQPNGFTLIELMIVIAIIAIVAAIAVPGILGASRAANERNASASLKQMSSIQTTFKASDTDGDQNNDFWVSDVAGLFYVSTSSPISNIDQLSRMIEVSVAQADADTLRDWGAYTGGTMTHRISPKAGYWFVALWEYQSSAGGTPIAYTSGSVSNDRWAMAAYPNDYGSSGKLGFILSEAGTQFKRDVSGTVWSTAPATGTGDSSALLTAPFDTFPFDPIGSGWSKMD